MRWSRYFALLAVLFCAVLALGCPPKPPALVTDDVATLQTHIATLEKKNARLETELESKAKEQREAETWLDECRAARAKDLATKGAKRK